MELSERFRYVMKLNQMSASAFADEIGVQRSSISHILSGRNKPSLEFIQKVLKRFPKVDAAWLISGVTQAEPSEVYPPEETREVQRSAHASQIKSSLTAKESDDQSQDATVSSKPSKRGRISKIVIFYDDQTFEEFNP